MDDCHRYLIISGDESFKEESDLAQIYQKLFPNQVAPLLLERRLRLLYEIVQLLLEVTQEILDPMRNVIKE